jgi:hypothetical protein
MLSLFKFTSVDAAADADAWVEGALLLAAVAFFFFCRPFAYAPRESFGLFVAAFVS